MYNTDTKLRLGSIDIARQYKMLMNSEILKDVEVHRAPNMAAEMLTISLYEYSKTGITYKGTSEIIENVLGLNN